jgi:hypothetical protein
MSFFCIVFINIMAFIAVRVRVRVRVRVHGESFLQKCIFIDQYALFNGVFFFFVVIIIVVKFLFIVELLM